MTEPVANYLPVSPYPVGPYNTHEWARSPGRRALPSQWVAGDHDMMGSHGYQSVLAEPL